MEPTTGNAYYERLLEGIALPVNPTEAQAAAIKKKLDSRVYMELGGIAIDVEMFEAAHDHLHLKND